MYLGVLSLYTPTICSLCRTFAVAVKTHNWRSLNSQMEKLLCHALEPNNKCSSRWGMHQWISCFTWGDLTTCFPYAHPDCTIGEHWHCFFDDNKCHESNAKIVCEQNANQMNYISISEWATSFSLSFVLRMTSNCNERIFSIIAIEFLFAPTPPLTSYERFFEALTLSVEKKCNEFRRLKVNCTKSTLVAMPLAANAIRIENVFRSEQTRRWKSFNELHGAANIRIFDIVISKTCILMLNFTIVFSSCQELPSAYIHPF